MRTRGFWMRIERRRMRWVSSLLGLFSLLATTREGKKHGKSFFLSFFRNWNWKWSLGFLQPRSKAKKTSAFAWINPPHPGQARRPDAASLNDASLEDSPAHMYTHTLAFTRTHTHTHPHAPTLTSTHEHLILRDENPFLLFLRVQLKSFFLSLSRTHTCTHAQTHKCTHAHSLSLSQVLSLFLLSSLLILDPRAEIERVPFLIFL